MDRRRVVVTGLGALTPVGNTADEFWTALMEARSGVGPITKFDASVKNAQGEFLYPTRIAAEVRGFDPLKFVDKKEARRLDPFLQYAMACSVMAVEDAGLDTGTVDELASLLSETLHHEVKRRFDHMMEFKARSDRGLAESRDYTEAMLGLQVWSHKLNLAMRAAAHEGTEEHHG